MPHRIVLHHVHIMLGSSPHDVPQLHMYKYTVSAFVPEFFLKLCRNTMMQMSAILFKHTSGNYNYVILLII